MNNKNNYLIRAELRWPCDLSSCIDFHIRHHCCFCFEDRLQTNKTFLKISYIERNVFTKPRKEKNGYWCCEAVSLDIHCFGRCVYFSRYFRCMKSPTTGQGLVSLRTFHHLPFIVISILQTVNQSFLKIKESVLFF